MDVRGVGNRVHALNGEVELGRSGGDAVAEEAGRRDADDGDRLGVDPEGATDDGRVGVEVVLPGVVAHDGDHGSALDVVGVEKETAGGRLKAEGAKVVAGDELAHDGAGEVLGSIAAGDDGTVDEAGLHGGEVGELGVGVAEATVGIGGEDGVVGVLKACPVAAAVNVAEADERFGVGDGQAAEEDGVDEGEDGCVGSDAEREGEEDRKGEGGSLAKLADGVEEVLLECGHCCFFWKSSSRR